MVEFEPMVHHRLLAAFFFLVLIIHPSMGTHIQHGQLIFEVQDRDLIGTIRGEVEENDPANSIALFNSLASIEVQSCTINGKTCLVNPNKFTVTIGCVHQLLPNGTVIEDPCTPTSSSSAINSLDLNDNGALELKFVIKNYFEKSTTNTKTIWSAIGSLQNIFLLQFNGDFNLEYFLIKLNDSYILEPNSTFCYSPLKKIIGGYTVVSAYDHMYLSETTIPAGAPLLLWISYSANVSSIVNTTPITIIKTENNQRYYANSTIYENSTHVEMATKNSDFFEGISQFLIWPAIILILTLIAAFLLGVEPSKINLKLLDKYFKKK